LAAMSDLEAKVLTQKPASSGDCTSLGHNGGPPLNEEHRPEWGEGGIGNYFYWKAAHRRAWHGASRDVVLFRMQKAERLGLTYQEYTLEILERGRHLQIEHAERIAEIKQARQTRTAK